MEIRLRADGAVVMEQEFRRMFPNTSLPQQLSEALINELGGDIVFEGPQATPTTPYQYSQRQGVEQRGSKWYTKYVLGPVFADMVVDGQTITAAQQEAEYKARKDADQGKAVRDQRNQKLAQTDWTQGKDIPENISSKWATYRQALRDVPAQAGFPWDVQWPAQPE